MFPNFPYPDPAATFPSFFLFWLQKRNRPFFIILIWVNYIQLYFLTNEKVVAIVEDIGNYSCVSACKSVAIVLSDCIVRHVSIVTFNLSVSSSTTADDDDAENKDSPCSWVALRRTLRLFDGCVLSIRFLRVK